MRLPTRSEAALRSRMAPACDTEKLVAEAKEIKYGSTIAVYEVNVYKADGTMVATSTQSYFIVSGKNKGTAET